MSESDITMESIDVWTNGTWMTLAADKGWPPRKISVLMDDIMTNTFEVF
jgi:hypothetical protein